MGNERRRATEARGEAFVRIKTWRIFNQCKIVLIFSMLKGSLVRRYERSSAKMKRN
jgi:hypothetical protein